MSSPVTETRAFWRHDDGTRPNTIAFGYIFGGHALGIWLITRGELLPVVLGILLTAHTMVIAAYMIHEVAHGTISRSRDANRRMGEALAWMTGAAYASFDRIRHMHLRHHGDRADLSCFDYRAMLAKMPKPVLNLILALEWLYVPALELLILFRVRLEPFRKPALAHERARVFIVGATRLLFLGGIFWLSPWALLFYAIAYALFIKAMHLGDAYAHTYEEFVIATPDEPVPQDGRDAAYDHAHTFSNLVSVRYPWLNLLYLNFGYHNAHHYHATTPWHRLPQLHAKLYGDSEAQVMPFGELLRTISRNRVRKITSEDPGDVGTGPGRADQFLGVHGVSFLSVV